jgi:hypothetical protein
MKSQNDFLALGEVHGRVSRETVGLYSWLNQVAQLQPVRVVFPLV